MRASVYQVVTFAKHPLRGNPAFVLRDVADAPDAALAGISGNLNCDVIAVVGDQTDGEAALRFFTPQGPHPGAGHATMAAAHVVLRPEGGRDEPPQDVVFRLENGETRVARKAGEKIAVGFPRMAAYRVERVADMESALGANVAETLVSAFGYIGILKDASTIASLKPNMDKISAFDRIAVIATAPDGYVSDIAIRVFAPNAGLPEDPVCGTAHRIIIPYWAEHFGKAQLHSRHLSPRGGDLWCEALGENVIIAGESCTVLSGTVELPV